MSDVYTSLLVIYKLNITWFRYFETHLLPSFGTAAAEGGAVSTRIKSNIMRLPNSDIAVK